MFFANKVEILVVDDEPDVLSVTRLALRHTKVFGLPIVVHTAESKARAAELLSTTLATAVPGHHTAEVAFIDVVMESDHAGLDLCEHIRADLKNHDMQLYLRTGQPGIAPEREVIDRYDINGYLSKAEVTETKLYTLVKTGVREFHVLMFSRTFGELVQMLIPAARSHRQLGATLDAFVASLQTSGPGQRQEGYDIRLAFLSGDDLVAGTWLAEGGGGTARRDALLGTPARLLGPTGDALYTDGAECLLRVEGDATTAPIDVLTRGSIPPPEFVVPLWHGLARSLGALWRLGE